MPAKMTLVFVHKNTRYRSEKFFPDKKAAHRAYSLWKYNKAAPNRIVIELVRFDEVDEIGEDASENLGEAVDTRRYWYAEYWWWDEDKNILRHYFQNGFPDEASARKHLGECLVNETHSIARMNVSYEEPMTIY